MKSYEDFAVKEKEVASFAEAWIEITSAGIKRPWKVVATFAEAWIEIGNPHYSSRCCYVVSSQR